MNKSIVSTGNTQRERHKNDVIKTKLYIMINVLSLYIGKKKRHAYNKIHKTSKTSKTTIYSRHNMRSPLWNTTQDIQDRLFFSRIIEKIGGIMKRNKLWGCPGTGKTTKLIAEIKELEQQGYEREQFTICTFRRTMAEELQSRLEWDKKTATVATIHGVCKRLAGIDKIVEGKHITEFCKANELGYQSGAEYDPDPIKTDAKAGSLFFDAKSFLINNLLECSDIYEYPNVGAIEDIVPDPESWIQHYMDIYQDWKVERGLSDFDDMLQSVHEESLTPDSQVLVVDEFQDLTPLHYEIIKEWEKAAEIVMIAGDPRQTLYGFWGANPLFFEQHPGTEIILDTTYRLPSNGWKFAQEIIKTVGLKIPEIKTAKGPGVLQTISAEQAEQIIPNIKESVLHLVRTNMQGIMLGRILAQLGVPYQGIGGWGEKQIELYNAILKVRMSLAGGTQTFTKGELEAIIDAYPKEQFTKKKKELKEWIKQQKKLLEFSRIEGFAQLNLFGRRELWQHLISNVPLDIAKGGLADPQNLGRIKILNALEKYQKLITVPGVTISTIHGAKGGEADYVFLYTEIPKLVYNLLYKDFNQNTIEQEAQVFYVGASRHRQALFIVEGGKYQYELPQLN